MLFPCEYQNCAVCHNLKEREILEGIFETDLSKASILCRQAMYKVTNADGAEFVLPSLDGIKKGPSSGRYYVHDMYTANIIYLNKNNFKILCSKEGECTKTLCCK